MKKRIRVNGILYEAVDKDNLKNVKIPGYEKFIDVGSEVYDEEEDEVIPLGISSTGGIEDWDTMFAGGYTCYFFAGGIPVENEEVYFSFYTVYDDKDDDYSWHFLCSDGRWDEYLKGYDGTTWAPKKDPMNKKDAINLYNKAAKIMSGEYDFGSIEGFCTEVDKRSAKLLSSLGMRETDYYRSSNYDNRTKNEMRKVDIPKFDVAKERSLSVRGEAYVESEFGNVTFYVPSGHGYAGTPVCRFFIEELDSGEYCFEINYYRSFWSKDDLTKDEAVDLFNKTAKIMSDSYPLNDTEWFVETVEKNVKKVVRQLRLKKS